MNIHVMPRYSPSIEGMSVELVERKGVGHPDTLADMVADEFSNRYSRLCLERFGVILHHWADKVTLVGGKANISFGKTERLAPIRAFQFGRVTPDLGGDKIDIGGIFSESVLSVMERVFAGADVSEWLACEAITHDGAGPDHPREFYDPHSAREVANTQTTPKSNDTMIMTSYAGYSRLDILCLEVENYLNSPTFKVSYPATGYDVKVLAARVGRDVDLTVCIPLVAQETPSLRAYVDTIARIKEDVVRRVHDKWPEFNVILHMNTKDEGSLAYLTAFGTSLDKGGCGAVGRGNRFNGLITPTREMAVEAPSGKNPTHHAGRIYSEACFRISRDIFLECGVEHSLNLVARNGDPLPDPALVVVKCSCEVAAKQRARIEEIVESHIGSVVSLTREIIATDVVEAHRSRPRQMYSSESFLGELSKQGLRIEECRDAESTAR